MMKRLLEHISAEWPPAPHDPRKRTYAGRIDQWEVRIYSRCGTTPHAFSEKEFFHLQLWHPRWKVSVLTPSHLTGHFFELYPFQGGKLPVCCLKTVNTVLEQHFHAPEIDQYVLSLMERYLLFSESLRDMNNQSANGGSPDR